MYCVSCMRFHSFLYSWLPNASAYLTSNSHLSVQIVKRTYSVLLEALQYKRLAVATIKEAPLQWVHAVQWYMKLLTQAHSKMLCMCVCVCQGSTCVCMPW